MALGAFVRIGAGISLLVFGTLLGLYGLVACTYKGDSESDTYVELAGRQIDASYIGVIVLIAALLALGVGVELLRGGR